MKITHKSHSEIDKKKWNEFLASSERPLIYAHSDYLDVLSPKWNALVMGDYEAIFPLPVKKKLGMTYVAHPLFCQQLGLFTSENIEGLSDEMIGLLKKKYRRYLLRLNVDSKPTSEECELRTNYVLPLKGEVDLEKNYNQNTKRNLKKFKTGNLMVTEDLGVNDFIDFKRSNSRASLHDSEWNLMKKLSEMLISKKMGFFKVVRKEGEILSAVLFASWQNRLYYLFSASNEEGMESRASFGIVHQVILEYADKGCVLDFEGSMDANIARFFSGFGAVSEEYCEIKRAL